MVATREGRRGAHDEADGGLPPARHADHDLHQQARPRRPPPIDLLDENRVGAGIQCAPMTWPIGMGQRLKGVVHLLSGDIILYGPGRNFTRQDSTISPSLDDPRAGHAIGAQMLAELRESWNWSGASASVRPRRLPGRQTATPVFFGSASTTSACSQLLDFLRRARAPPRPRGDHSATSRPEPKAHRLRVQDPGEHGSDASRPDRVHAHLPAGSPPACLLPPPHRQGRSSSPTRDVPGRPTANRREARTGRRDRPPTTARSRMLAATRSPKASRCRSPGSPNFAPELFRRARLRDRSSSSGYCRRGWHGCREEGAASSSAADEQRSDPRRGRYACSSTWSRTAWKDGRRRRHVRAGAGRPRAGSATKRRSWRNSATNAMNLALDAAGNSSTSRLA